MDIIQILILITFILFIAKILQDSFYLLWQFQVKEYRTDRMRSHLRERIDLNLSDLIIVAGVFILLGLFYPATANFILVSAVLFLGLITPLYFLYALGRGIFSALHHSFKRPKPTLKMILIGAVYLFLYASSVLLISMWILENIKVIYSPDFFMLFAFYLLLLNALVPIFILLAIALITPLNNFKKRRIAKKARLKMSGMRKVKTIGITGSFGKTSTKEFLYAILSQKYKVIKTTGNNNSYMGVAGTVLQGVDDTFDYFICEMGAYKIGEIKEICDMVSPFAAIITGINEQHLDLFGSLENTKKAKFELVQSLPKEGFAVINEKALNMKPKLGYNVQDVISYGEDLVSKVAVHPDHLEFEYKATLFRANILGKHYIGNLLAAIIVAEKLGMSLTEIQTSIAKLELRSDYLMQKLEGINGSVFIDDSYSANRSGVIAALEYVEQGYPEHKKILVFPGIIELGKNSEVIHRDIWRKTDEVCQLAYILKKRDETVTNHYKRCRFVFERDFDKMKSAIEKQIDKDTVVLFESRGARVVMNKLLDDKKK